MQSWASPSGAFVIAWSQTEVDGHGNAPEDRIVPGSYWRWRGEAVALDKAIGPAVDDDAFPDSETERRRIADAARGLVGRALGVTAGDAGSERSFTLSDGRDHWIATLIDVAGLPRPLVLFTGAMPPVGQPLKVTGVEARRNPLLLTHAEGVVCFTPETWIDTPGGARQIGHLVAGDKVMTLDGGVQEIVWTGRRRLSLRELVHDPDLAPVRIRQGAFPAWRQDGDLLVSPDHRMLVRGRTEGGESEVLVAARDLVDDVGILREVRCSPVTYVHLLLEQHHILLANGFETESFHPGAARLDAIPAEDRARLLDVLPGLRRSSEVYGPTARPVIGMAEARLMTAA